jgi:hypothetical protein
MSRAFRLQTLMIFSFFLSVYLNASGQFPRSSQRKPLTAEQKKLLAGSAEDQAKYANFLKQSDTGMFRLLPRVDYETSLTVSAQTPEQSLPIRGGGAYYSFGRKTHIFGAWSDICLQDKILFTQVANPTIGLFTVIGDVPLESVTPQSPGVDFLTKMTIPTLVSEASAQVKRNDRGFQEGEFSYRSAVRVFPDLTYVLRSVGYKRPDFLMVVPGTSVTISSANVYQGADLLIAFRIIRQEENGAVTILWKRLKKASAPQLKRDKK